MVQHFVLKPADIEELRSARTLALAAIGMLEHAPPAAPVVVREVPAALGRMRRRNSPPSH